MLLISNIDVNFTWKLAPLLN